MTTVTKHDLVTKIGTKTAIVQLMAKEEPGEPRSGK